MSVEILLAHEKGDIAQVEGLQGAEATCVDQDQDGQNLAVRHWVRAVAAKLVRNRKAFLRRCKLRVFSNLARKTSTYLHLINQYSDFMLVKWV